jgi:hypothetical protein
MLAHVLGVRAGPGMCVGSDVGTLVYSTGNDFRRVVHTRVACPEVCVSAARRGVRDNKINVGRKLIQFT